MRTSSLLSLAASISSALALYKGFNYGSSGSDGAYEVDDFTGFFELAADLAGTDAEFTSARLYTMIQSGTTNTPISALSAAQNTKTSLLLGMWASGGSAGFADELDALTSAISDFASLSSQIVGISVGSEDLYRISPTATQQGNTDPGAEPSTLVDYISQVRTAIAGTAWKSIPVGHVDTWTAWANSSNDVVADACDFVGVDAYPYFQNTESNSITDGAALLESALASLTPAAMAKDVWITETGWPVSGPTENLAVPSVANAQTYWDQAGCGFAFAKYNTWWYTLDDYGSSPSFGVITPSSSTPLYNLTCGATSSSSTTSSAPSSTSTATPNSDATSHSSTSTVTPNPDATTHSTTTAPITSSMEYDVTETVYQTYYVTVTAESCCAAPPATVTVKSTATVSITTSTSASTSTSTSTACPANLEGSYLSPNLIIPVSSASPNTAYGTSYYGIINSTVSSIFTFDIPASYAGKTCSLIFLFPELSQLETSSYTFNSEGGIDSYLLNGNANTSTTYANAPAVKVENGEIASLTSGNSYVISSDSCPAGTEVSFELKSTGGLALNFFEDYNPSPLGLYVRAC